MGEAANDILSGLMCQHCGGFIDGQEPGFPRSCSRCRRLYEEDDDERWGWEYDEDEE